MPIVLAQQSPMGGAASIGVGAGEAEATQKMAPTLAALYERIAEARQRAATSGGGGGSSSFTPGGGGVGGGGGDGTYQAEAQANRQQQADNESFAAQQQNRLQQNQFAQQNQQQAAGNATLAQLNGPPAQAAPSPTPPAPQWGAADDQLLQEAQNAATTIGAEFENGKVDAETASVIQGNAQDKIQALTARKDAATQAKQQQQFTQGSTAAAQSAALNQVHTAAEIKGGYTLPSAIPGMPAAIYKLDHQGKAYIANEKQIEIAEKVWSKQQDHAAEDRKAAREERAARQKDLDAKKDDNSVLTSVRHHTDKVNSEEQKWRSNGALDVDKPSWLDDKGSEIQRRVKDERATVDALTGKPAAKPDPTQTPEYKAAFKEAYESKMREGGFTPEGKPLPKEAEPDVTTKEGQMKALDAIIKMHADRTPVPSPRKTLEPPGPHPDVEKEAVNTTIKSGLPYAGSWN